MVDMHVQGNCMLEQTFKNVLSICIVAGIGPIMFLKSRSSLSDCQEYTTSFSAKILNIVFMQYPLFSEL